MKRRDAVKLLSVLPAVGLLSSGVWAAEPSTVALEWDWAPGADEPINYFEVFVTARDVMPSESNSRVIRVPGNARSCVVSLPNRPGPCQARVRAANAHGLSAFTSPILISA